MKNYFENFPIITYQNFKALNLLDRAAIRDNLKLSVSNYFRYEIRSGMRPDQVANDVYGVPEYDWIIFLMNNIIDTYYGWPLNDQDLNATIVNKYGSLASAMEKILYWENNWYSDTSVITVDTYNSLDASQKSYWAPVIQRGNKVSGYSRKRIDIKINTNKLGRIDKDVSVGNFSVGDKIISQANSSVYAEVEWANTTTLIVKNINQFSDGLVNIVDTDSEATSNGTFTTFSVGGIPDLELNYYDPITAYEMELEKNHEKTLIILLKPEFIDQAVNLVGAALQQNGLI